MPPPTFRWEYPRAALPRRQSLQQLHGGGADWTKLVTGLCIRITNATGARVDPRAWKGKGFHAAQARQQQQAEGGKGGGTLAGRFGFPHCFSELGDFLDGQKAPLPAVGGLLDPPCRVLRDELEGLPGIFEDGSKHSHCPSRYPRSASSGAPAPLILARLRGLTGDDVP